MSDCRMHQIVNEGGYWECAHCCDRFQPTDELEKLQAINAVLLTELKAGLSIARRAIRPDPKNGLHDLALWTEAARFVIKAAEQRS